MSELSRERVFQEILLQLNLREDFFRAELARLQESKSADTKSSAGDKFETGREMIAQEMSKLQGSLELLKRQKAQLEALLDLKSTNSVREGSIIYLTGRYLLLGASLGELQVGKQKVFLLSRSSPLGSQLLGKKKGDLVQFMGKSSQIEEIF
ncbi:hypothetical protein [Algoriphagus namhaensis]